MNQEQLTHEFERIRPQLTSFLTRLVIRPAVAEELVQQTAVRALEAIETAPQNHHELRPWLFRIASNLGIDERRRHRTRFETPFIELKPAAKLRPDFMAEMKAFRGTPESLTAAREHLAMCFSCTLGRLPAHHASALLLKEAGDFTTREIAEILSARFAQVKNWLQEARRVMDAEYATTCTLINKQGVCYQCAELDGYFHGERVNPLQDSDGSVHDRLNVIGDLRSPAPNSWTNMLLRLLDEMG